MKNETSLKNRDSIQEYPIDRIVPSPENTKLYCPVSKESVSELARDIARNGVREPLVITLDGFILSGHRRHAAARLAGLNAVPVRIDPISRVEEPERFREELARYNWQQRTKTPVEEIREAAAISGDTDFGGEDDVFTEGESCNRDFIPLEIGGERRRSKITNAGIPFLNGAIGVLNELIGHRPLTLRMIHYRLLNNPPLRHARKPGSVYRNDRNSYQALSRLLTAARLEGRIPFECIADETRPFSSWDVFQSVGAFVTQEVNFFLEGYRRDLLRSQPDHVEVLGEKNTIRSVIGPVCKKYGIPMTLGRGYCSIPPLHDIAERFRESGKARLVLVFVNDFDPEGEDIPQATARTLRDDFGLGDRIECVKAALTKEQVHRLNLQPNTEAKVTSSRFKRFAKENGRFAYELEALHPEALQDLLEDTVRQVIDLEGLNKEIDRQRRERECLKPMKAAAREALLDVME